MPDIIKKFQKLKENGAWNILLHPEVLRNKTRYDKELSARPEIMTAQPPGLGIEMTNRCNLACVQCLRSLGLKPYKLGDMDYENYKKILVQFPYAMNIVLNGFGEPMMHRQFFEIVAHTRKTHPWAKIGIYTNGMLIDEEKARRSMNCGLTELNISIDAAKPETYRRVRRGGKLDILHENIKRLVKIKKETRSKFPLIGMNFVMVNENEGELVPFIEQAADFGVDYIGTITFASYDWGFKNRRSADSYFRELDAAEKRMDELGMRCRSFPSRNISWSDPTQPFNCNFFWGENFQVNYNGDITLGCCTPFKETFSYGNVLETPFKEIWNGEKYTKNRRLAANHTAPCKACGSCDQFSKNFFIPPDQSKFISLNEIAVQRAKELVGR